MFSGAANIVREIDTAFLVILGISVLLLVMITVLMLVFAKVLTNQGEENLGDGRGQRHERAVWFGEYRLERCEWALWNVQAIELFSDVSYIHLSKIS